MLCIFQNASSSTLAVKFSSGVILIYCRGRSQCELIEQSKPDIAMCINILPSLRGVLGGLPVTLNANSLRHRNFRRRRLVRIASSVFGYAQPLRLLPPTTSHIATNRHLKNVHAHWTTFLQFSRRHRNFRRRRLGRIASSVFGYAQPLRLLPPPQAAT